MPLAVFLRAAGLSIQHFTCIGMQWSGAVSVGLAVNKLEQLNSMLSASHGTVLSSCASGISGAGSFSSEFSELRLELRILERYFHRPPQNLHLLFGRGWGNDVGRADASRRTSLRRKAPLLSDFTKPSIPASNRTRAPCLSSVFGG